jgi:hypothetical protein
LVTVHSGRPNGFTNLRSLSKIEYCPSAVSEDFELMIHLYNLGSTGDIVRILTANLKKASHAHLTKKPAVTKVSP